MAGRTGRCDTAVVALLAAAIAGCGDNLTVEPDASLVTICGAPSGRIDSVPGEFTGRTVGAGDNVHVAEGACADQELYFGSAGEDQIVDVAGLTAGQTYVIELDTAEDLSFYVATMCDADGPSDGACLLHVDRTTARELDTVVAPATGVIAIVVDSANEPAAPTAGDYTLRVRAAECLPDMPEVLACTDPTRAVCVEFGCVECATGFDCTAPATPACGADGTCVAGSDQCTGDDGGEPDDGPAAARVVAVPGPATPTVITAAVCNLDDTEADWYAITLAADGALRFELAWTDASADLDATLHAADGAELAAAAEVGTGPEVVLATLEAGTYYLRVARTAPAAAAVATPYTLTVERPECLTSFDCSAAATPVCDVGHCVAGSNDCTGDDAADAGAGGDDGPAAARLVAGGVGVPQVLTGKACNVPAAEADWYRLTTVVGQGITMSLAFAAGQDLDVEAFDAAGNLLGRSWWVNPEAVALTYLPAGSYYVKVTRFSNQIGGDPVAEPYTITFTRTLAQLCATRADCAAEYSNQIYRGTCSAAGACTFIPDGTRAAGAPCDSPGDCDSGQCSYRVYEADAQASVCTIECTITDDCVALAGTTCTTGFLIDVCVPACASDLECGANQRSDNLDAGQPWDYVECTRATGVCSPL